MYKRCGGYTKNISNMGAGWMCMEVLTIRPSLSLERGPPVHNGREIAEPRPVLDVRHHEDNRSIIRLEIRFLPSCQSGQQLLYVDEDKTTLITLLISNASCVKT